MQKTYCSLIKQTLKTHIRESGKVVKEKTPNFRTCSKCKREFVFANTRICPQSKTNSVICGYCCRKNCEYSEGNKCLCVERK